jgi:Tfp pilus assembly protein PilZ
MLVGIVLEINVYPVKTKVMWVYSQAIMHQSSTGVGVQLMYSCDRPTTGCSQAIINHIRVKCK